MEGKGSETMAPSGHGAPAGNRRQAAAEFREKLGDWIADRVNEGNGHATISTRSLAEHFSVTPTTVASHLHALVDDGRFRTRPAGRQGLIVSLGGGRRGRRPAAAPGRAATGRAAARTAASGRATPGSYCHWCGAKVQRGWRYCNRCGTPLSK